MFKTVFVKAGPRQGFCFYKKALWQGKAFKKRLARRQDNLGVKDQGLQHVVLRHHGRKL
jgi:hypothetical protein